MTVSISPTSIQIGFQSISLKLVDFQNHKTQYSLLLSLQDLFEYKPGKILDQRVVYPQILSFSIEELLFQFSESNVAVLVKENIKVSKKSNYEFKNSRN